MPRVPLAGDGSFWYKQVSGLQRQAFSMPAACARLSNQSPWHVQASHAPEVGLDVPSGRGVEHHAEDLQELERDEQQRQAQ